MSSGSLKDLSKAISSTLSAHISSLPDELVQVLDLYLTKRAISDDESSQRLQEELLFIYSSYVSSSPENLGPFLSILRSLKPAIRGSGRLLQWWDKLSKPVLDNLGTQKGLAADARASLLDILLWEEDENDEEGDEIKNEKISTSEAISRSLVVTWLEMSKKSLEEFDNQARFVEGQVEIILFSFGKRRPKDFLNTINTFFVKKESRILALSLLCRFIQHQPPHLHQLLETPLFDHLLQCLQADTSTRVISLAMTALIMVLPHIPSSLTGHLPALFNIYSRMLFWDRERKASDVPISDDFDGDDTESQPVAKVGNSWDKMSYILESEDETVPELVHYFTFLYGLYPINFMSYIRKPQRYLRHANFPGAADWAIEPIEIRERSEPFRQAHLLHPNFFMLTLETELTDNNRWIKSEAAGVVAECMALYIAVEDNHRGETRARGPLGKVDPNADIPDHSISEEAAQVSIQSRHTSWRNTQSTEVASPESNRFSNLQRKLSQASQSLPSVTDSPSVHPEKRGNFDSPTIPPELLGPQAQNSVTDRLDAHQPTLDNLYQMITNDSVASLSLSIPRNDTPAHIDDYLDSLSRGTIPRSPSLRPMPRIDSNMQVAYLYREIQLLRNDLNFEQYLKAQHISHIGQLRRKQIREARVEAETQNLINSNRQLKTKYEEARRINTQIKKENEKSKFHSRKWEGELSTKLRALREEQKKWNIERDELKQELATAKENTDHLRQFVITSESRELSIDQKVQSVESSLDELRRLRKEVDKLTFSLRTYEAGENKALQAHDNEEAALRKVDMLQKQLEARDKELDLAKQTFDREVTILRGITTQNSQDVADGNGSIQVKHQGQITQSLLDSALAVSRNRVVEIQKAHNHLLKRYTTLQNQYLEIKEQMDRKPDNYDGPLLAGGISEPARPSKSNIETYPFPSSKNLFSSNRPDHFNTDAIYDGLAPAGPLPTRLDTFVSPLIGTESRSPLSDAKEVRFQDPQAASRGSGDSESQDGSSKSKIKPQSDFRMYGRGGVQNIGKKEKEKKDKGKEKEGEGEGKKEKRGGGIRALRGFG